MIYGIYSIRDKHTGFVYPTFDLNDQAAARNFSMALSRSDAVLHFAPGDFDLYCIGSFDSDSGIVFPRALPELVMTGSQAFLVDLSRKENSDA